MFGKMPALKIGKHTAGIPIVQGGMGVGISLSGLASAVADEGGIGVIASVGLGMSGGTSTKNVHEENSRLLRQEIRTARDKSDGLIGVNIMMALTDHERLLVLSEEEKVDVVFIGAGLVLKLPQVIVDKGLDNIHTQFVPIVSSGRAVKIIFKQWAKKYQFVPNAVVVEGPLAGGHLGFKTEQLQNNNNSIKNLLTDVKSAIKPFEEKFNKKISVIVGGGIYTGADIYKYLRLGADGIQMATRFVATHECDADVKFKETYVNCKKEDLEIIQSPVGLPGRAISNDFLKSVSQGTKKPFKCPWKCLRTCDISTAPYCIANALISARKGRLKSGFAFAGANAYKVTEIISVKELVNTLRDEYHSEAITMRKFSKIKLSISQNPDLIPEMEKVAGSVNIY